MNADILQLALAKGVGDVAIKKFLKYTTNNKYYNFDTELFNILGFNQSIIKSILENKNIAMKLMVELQNNDIEIILETSKDYPKYLKNMLKEKCPPILFVKGNKALLNTVGVGFCGSRNVSGKGIKITKNCVEQLIEHDSTIVSGYAKGTDLAAHVKALESGGNTIFVLAEGILRLKIKKEIFQFMNTNNFVFVSQFMPNVTWNAGNAMKRNSTIIGLSQSMILIESRLEGGTFAAGEEALKVKCPLFVIDFAKPEVSAEANPHFINKGGIAIRGDKNGIPNMKNVFLAIEKNVRVENLSENIQLSL